MLRWANTLPYTSNGSHALVHSSRAARHFGQLQAKKRSLRLKQPHGGGAGFDWHPRCRQQRAVCDGSVRPLGEGGAWQGGQTATGRTPPRDCGLAGLCPPSLKPRETSQMGVPA